MSQGAGELEGEGGGREGVEGQTGEQQSGGGGAGQGLEQDRGARPVGSGGKVPLVHVLCGLA